MYRRKKLKLEYLGALCQVKSMCVFGVHIGMGERATPGAGVPLSWEPTAEKPIFTQRECHGVMVHSFKGLTASLLFVRDFLTISNYHSILTPLS